MWNGKKGWGNENFKKGNVGQSGVTLKTNHFIKSDQETVFDVKTILLKS